MANAVLGHPERLTPLPGALAALGAGAAIMGAAVVLTLDWQGAPLAAAVVMYVLATGLTLHALPAHGPRPFGWANVVTTGRLAALCYVAAALIAAARDMQTGPVWIAVVVTFTALAMDGVDGFLARRSGLSSPFGARFDMEVDAALILLLSVAAWELGKAGGWVVAVGAMRYVFVLAQQVLPRLRAPLPPSFARKAVCVLQVSALCIAVIPLVPATVSAPLAGAALAALLWSFARDTLRLLGAPDRTDDR